MSELQEPWRTAGEQRGLGSYRAIARASDLSVETVRKVIRGERRPNTATAAKLATAFGVDAPMIDKWAGVTSGESSDDYTPPAEARRLNRRQRRALDEIIRSMVQAAPASHDLPLPANAFELAAYQGENHGRRIAEDADRRGEESQDPDDRTMNR